MLLELLLAIIVGCLLGLVSGLTPGLHINLLAAIILSSLPFLSSHFSILAVAVAIIAMSITHTFTDFIPTIFLGAASEDTALAAYPGNELLLLGLGFDAVRLTAVGGLLGLALFSVLAPLPLLVVPLVFRILSGYIGVILLCFSALLILWQRTASERLWSSAFASDAFRAFRGEPAFCQSWQGHKHAEAAHSRSY
ncbi:tripartite tricarboxylate transporter permease [Candidatus Woesearchaeota archaeon]|nr:tripartite tricarboxylate transporter permease [Candidatus Woesearchaeota archaeon]